MKSMLMICSDSRSSKIWGWSRLNTGGIISDVTGQENSYALVDEAGLGYNSSSILARRGKWQKAEPTL